MLVFGGGLSKLEYYKAQIVQEEHSKNWKYPERFKRTSWDLCPGWKKTVLKEISRPKSYALIICFSPLEDVLDKLSKEIGEYKILHLDDRFINILVGDTQVILQPPLGDQEVMHNYAGVELSSLFVETTEFLSDSNEFPFYINYLLTRIRRRA